MRAGQVMSHAIMSIPSDATVFEAVQLLVGTLVSAMPVVDPHGKMVGIVSEADLMRRAEIDTDPQKSWLGRLFADEATAASEYVRFHSRRVTDVMTREVVTVEEKTSLREVADKMLKHGVKRIPVLRGDVVVGIVSRANLLQALMSRETGGAAEPRTEDQLRRDVVKAVNAQPWTSSWPSNVVVSAGVVHLWGFVASEEVRTAYRVAAEGVPGVREVRNHMRIVPASVTMGV